MIYLTQLEILAQVTLAMILGAVLGLDREFSRKPAGLRTHMLVAGAAALIVKLSEISVIYFQEFLTRDILQLDPTRIFVAVVTGISFLGAGTIIRQGSGRRIEGLTTAATIWAVAAIGLAAGAGLYLISGVTTALVVGILFLPHHDE